MPASMKHIVAVPWTDDERKTLRQMWENGMGPALIGRMLGRSTCSVTKQTQTLKLAPQRPQPTLAPPPNPRPQPLRPGARTLPPLPSELNASD